MINPPSHAIGTDPHPDRGTMYGLFRFEFHSRPRWRISQGFFAEVERKLTGILIDHHEP
jgi:hypothetical protein